MFCLIFSITLFFPFLALKLGSYLEPCHNYFYTMSLHDLSGLPIIQKMLPKCLFHGLFLVSNVYRNPVSYTIRTRPFSGDPVVSSRGTIFYRNFSPLHKSWSNILCFDRKEEVHQTKNPPVGIEGVGKNPQSSR